MNTFASDLGAYSVKSAQQPAPPRLPTPPTLPTMPNLQDHAQEASLYTPSSVPQAYWNQLHGYWGQMGQHRNREMGLYNQQMQQHRGLLPQHLQQYWAGRHGFWENQGQGYDQHRNALMTWAQGQPWWGQYQQTQQARTQYATQMQQYQQRLAQARTAQQRRGLRPPTPPIAPQIPFNLEGFGNNFWSQQAPVGPIAPQQQQPPQQNRNRRLGASLQTPRPKLAVARDTRIGHKHANTLPSSPTPPDDNAEFSAASSTGPPYGYGPTWSLPEYAQGWGNPAIDPLHANMAERTRRMQILDNYRRSASINTQSPALASTASGAMLGAAAGAAAGPSPVPSPAPAVGGSVGPARTFGQGGSGHGPSSSGSGSLRKSSSQREPNMSPYIKFAASFFGGAAGLGAQTGQSAAQPAQPSFAQSAWNSAANTAQQAGQQFGQAAAQVRPAPRPQPNPAQGRRILSGGGRSSLPNMTMSRPGRAWPRPAPRPPAAPTTSQAPRPAPAVQQYTASLNPHGDLATITGSDY